MPRLTLADFSADQISRFGITERELDAAFEREQRYLTQPVKEITEDQWDEALGVLPPENWHTTAEGINVFFMCEYQIGTVTQQYGRFNGKYIVKNVDVTDKTTWINMGDMVNAG